MTTIEEQHQAKLDQIAQLEAQFREVRNVRAAHAEEQRRHQAVLDALSWQSDVNEVAEALHRQAALKLISNACDEKMAELRRQTNDINGEIRQLNAHLHALKVRGYEAEREAELRRTSLAWHKGVIEK